MGNTRNLKLLAVLSVFLLSLIGAAASAGTIYVDADAAPASADNGSSWENAFSYLQDALAVASVGDEIRVAQGTYKPTDGMVWTPEFDEREFTFQLISGVTIKGGYAGYGEPDPNARDIKAYETILSGDIGTVGIATDNCYHVVTGATNATLNGFIIKDGYSENAEAGLTSYGAGMLNYNDANSILISCTFADNHARFGGGLYNVESEVKVINCLFNNNKAKYDGGGLREVDGTSILTNCTFYNNEADTVNSDYCGGGMAIFNSDLSLTNCIFWANSDNNGSDESAQIHIENGTFSINYSCIQNWTGALGGTGNIDTAPCFADPCNGDYHLKSEGWRWDSQQQRWTYDDITSRCIDSGNPGTPLGDELLSIPGDPENRWGENLRINMGAYGGTAEASMPPYDWTLLPDITNDGVVNMCDFAYFASDWLSTSDSQPGDFDRNGTNNLDDLVFLANDWLGTTTWY